MRVALGNDHAGLPLKAAVVDELTHWGCEVDDLGTDATQSVDFPDYASRVGYALQTGRVERGILICGSGVGMAIAANKLHGVRGALPMTYTVHTKALSTMG